MPEKKYLIEIPDMPEGTGIWDAEKWERNKDAFMADNPTAKVFELGEYDAEDKKDTDQFLLTFDGDEDSSGIWDADKWERNREAFLQDYPEATVNRVRYVDYWGQQAEANRAKKAELQQLDAERNARLAELGYYDDVTKGQVDFSLNATNVNNLKPLSSAIEVNSVSGDTKFLDPNVQEFFAKDTADTERMAEIARLDAEYDANPSVVAYREWLAQMQKEQEKYRGNLRGEINTFLKEDVDSGKAGMGAAGKRVSPKYGMTPYVPTSEETAENEKREKAYTALKLLDKADIASANKGDKGFWAGAGDVAKEALLDTATQDDIEAYNEVGDILSKLESELGDLKAETITPEVLEKHLSPEDKMLIMSFFEYNKAMAEAQKDMSKAYKGGKIFAESVPFMIEFLATGGFYAAGESATQGVANAAKRQIANAFVKWVTKNSAKKATRLAVARGVQKATTSAISALAGTAIRTAASPGTYERMAEASVEIDKDGHLHRAKNAFKGGIDMYIENLSEMSGGAIGKAFGWLGKGAGKLATSLGGATFAKVGSFLGNNKTAQMLLGGWDKVAPKFAALGFHGIFEEVGEEILGNALREVTFVQPGALKEMFEDDNFGAMLLGFAPMTIFGAGVSAVSIGATNIQAAKLGEEMRNMMSSHYSADQIDYMLSGIQSAENADQMQEAINPMLDAISMAVATGQITQEEAKDEVDTIYRYGMFVAQNKALLFAQREQDRDIAEAKRTQMTDRYGRFWQDGDNVQIAELNDGRTVFVTSEAKEDGTVAIVDAVTGQKGFANISDIATEEVDGEMESKTNTMTMDAFLYDQIAMERKNAEQVRMTNERNAQIDALRGEIVPGTQLNLGTEGSPIIVYAKGSNRNGVSVIDQFGVEHVLGWEQAADALKKPIVVLTDKQILDAKIAERAAEMASRRRKYGSMSPTSETASEEAVNQAETTAAEEQRHIPMNEDGTVNERAFWEQDPEGYVAWNDEQNQDGGADSLEQISITKAETEQLLSAAIAATRTSDPVARKQASKEAARLMEKIALLETLEQRYDAKFQEEVAALEQTNATPTASMNEEDLTNMDAQYQSILSQTRLQRERVRVMQEYLNKLAEGSVQAVLLTRANYVERMKEEGCNDALIDIVQEQVEAGEPVAGFMAAGKVFLMDEGLFSIDEIRVTYVHERQHVFNRNNPQLVQRVADALGSRDQALEILKTFVGERALRTYEKDSLNALADEIICRSMEVAYSNENFSVDLQSRGISEDVISIITEIDNEQRQDQSLSHARRRSRRNSHADVPGAGSVREDGRNSGQVSRGVLDQEETRSSEAGERGDEAREGAESGEVNASDDENVPLRIAEKPEDPNGVTAEQIDEINRSVGGELEIGEEDAPVRFSISAIGHGAGLELLKNDGDGNVALVLPDGRKFNAHNLLKPEDIKSLPDTVLSYMMKDARVLGNIDARKEWMLWNKYTLMLNAILSKGSAENGGFEYLASQWQWIADTVYKTVATNSDTQYSFSLDITRVCKKNEAVINAIAEMQARLGYGITPGQIMDIYMSTIEEGYQVPCPVCYVFSRYIRNGKYATIMINGQRKYGSKLVDPRTLSDKEKDKLVKYWLKELKKIEDQNEKNENEINKANSDITVLLDEIDKLSKQITDPRSELTEEQKAQTLEKIHELDARYKAALNVVSQSSLDSWITQFAIYKKKEGGKEKWVLYEDSYMGFPEEMALDLRQTSTVMRLYPAIQRFRKSRGAAAGKEITFVSNNDLGDVALALGSKGATEGLATPRDMSEKEWAELQAKENGVLMAGQKNLYQQAVEETDPKKKADLLKKASERFASASEYAKRQSLRGGQRMWSWSDNIERLAPDVFVNLFQMEMLGGALQSYSKQLEGIKLVASMNGYVNGSLMGKGNGYAEVSEENIEEVDGRLYLKGGDFVMTQKDGKTTTLRTPVYKHTDGKFYVLEFDDVVGIDAFGKDIDGKHYKGLFELNSEYDKAGNILVGMNDLHIRIAMADDRIFFIIPWHSSGANSHILAQMYDYLGVEYDVTLSQDYTDVQSEKRIKGVGEKEEDSKKAKKGKEKKESTPVSTFLAEFWNDRYENAREHNGYGMVAGKDFACGIEGGIASSDGKGNLSEGQMHYRELRDAIFMGVKVQTGTDKKGKPTYKNVNVEEYSEEWFNEIMNDEFLSQVYSRVREYMGEEGRMASQDTKSIYPYEYWDEASTYATSSINGARYIEYCRRLGYKPKFCGKLDGKPETDFGNFTEDAGYWKTLIDRRMYAVDGKFQGLTPVTAENFTPDLVDPEATKEEFVVTRVADEKGTQTIVDRAIAKENNRPGGIAKVDYDMTLDKALKAYNNGDIRMRVSSSIDLVEEAKKAQAKHDAKEKENDVSFRITPEQDKAYMDAVEAGDMETAQRMVIEAARLAMPNTKVVDENGNPKVVYHGTTEGNNFTIFDRNVKKKDTSAFATIGFWFGESESFAKSFVVNSVLNRMKYGMRSVDSTPARTVPAFINITDPLVFETPEKSMQQKVLGFPNDDAYMQYKDAANMLSAKELEKLADEEGIALYREKMISEGKDGLIIKNTFFDKGHNEGKPNTQYAVFSPSQIKSAEPVTYDDNGNVIPLSERFNPENEDIRFRTSNNNQAIFVSNAAKAVEGIKMEKATPEQWLKMIEKNGGLKAGEDKWMGLSDWLKASDKKTLTKAEVLDFINENMIIIEEQHYSSEGVRAEADRILNENYPGWEDAFSFDWDPFMDEPHSDIYDEVKAARLYNETHEYQVETDEDGDIVNDADYNKVEEFGAELAGIWYGRGKENTVREIHGTREEYTTNGLTNLHEIALTVPTIESWNESDDIHFGDAGEGRAVAWIRFGETEIGTPYPRAEFDAIKAFEEENGVDIENWSKEQANEYRTLFAAFKKAQANKRVLVIDEIQSKRHQEGREKGYKDIKAERSFAEAKAKLAEKREALKNYLEFLESKYGIPESLNSERATEEEMQKLDDLRNAMYDADDELVAVRMANPMGFIPDAPFDKNWHELAMKRMLRYAAENGYDVIAWTKGKQQAERYSIGKVIEGIYKGEAKKEGTHSFEIRSYAPSAPRFITTNTEGKIIDALDNDGDEMQDYINKNLSEVFGKDLAQQMLGASEKTYISEEELVIGGEGMRGFYDKMLPAFMNKYGKKWGVKVEDIDLSNLENGLTMHSVPVTEEMKSSVMEGQVMFRINREDYDSAVSFTEAVVQKFSSKYFNTTPISILDGTKPEEALRALGLESMFTHKDIENVLAGYIEGKNIIAIFAKDRVREVEIDEDVIENAIFHECIHQMTTGKKTYDRLSKYLWDNADALGLSEQKADIETEYEESQWYYEMIASALADKMTAGETEEFLRSLPAVERAMTKVIFNKFGYEPGKEDIRRANANKGISRDNLRNEEGRSESQGGSSSETRFRATEITPEEKRKINEFFPGAFKVADSKGNILTPGQERFFANSKAVDKDGNLLVLYHGTPRAGFTEFTSGWFTTSKEDAISYSGDRKGRLFDPNEKYEPETLVAGDYRLGYMTFDSEEDRAAFLAEYPEAENAMSESEFDSMTLQADEEYDELIARKPELQKIWNAYREYERERFVDTAIGDIMENAVAYTEDDLRRAMLAYDSNANFDSLDDMDAEERRDALVTALRNADEETEGGIADIKVATRVPRNGEGLKHNDLGNRTYEVYANVENPYEIDAKGRGSEFESGDIYKAVEEALTDDQYDGVIIRNWRVGRYQQLGDVVVPKSGSQIKLTSNENPSEGSDIRFRTSLELDEEFGDAWRNQQNEDGRHSTQVANTKSTYEKIGRYLEDAGMKGASILDASSGLGLGTQALREMGFNVEDVEPFPSENREAPTYSSYADIDGKYDVVISNAVLNVIPDDWRADVLHQMADAVKDGGKMIINTRPASNIAQQGVEGKTRITLDSPSEILVKRGDRIAAYQKGFTSEELAEWIKSELGEGWRVEKATKKNSGISGEGTAVVIKVYDDTRFRTIGTPTEDVVAQGISLSPSQAASLAGDIFAALPEESRKKITDGLNGNILGLQDAIMQIPTSLAMKEDWNEEDVALANVVREKMQDLVDSRNGETARPLTTKEALWMLYRMTSKQESLVDAARNAIVGRNLGFDPDSIRRRGDVNDYIRFRTANGGAIDAATDMYNYETSLWTERLKESWLDMNQSVISLQNAMATASGMPIEPWENIEWALNRLSSKSYADKKKYLRDYLIPLWDAVMQMVKVNHISIEEIERYMMLKHGLERNEKLAKRDARTHYQEIYDDIIDKIKRMNPAQKRTYLTNAQLRDADAKAEVARLQAINTSAFTPDQLKQHNKDVAKAKKEADDAAEHLVRAQKVATMTEQDAQDELNDIFDNINNEIDPVYKEMRKNDYSGMSAMFVDKTEVKRSNYKSEEAYQKAVLENTKPRFQKVEDMEAEAESEVNKFERTNTGYLSLWTKVNAATKETLRHQYESGMITAEQYDAVRDMFEYYVPLRGFADNTAEDMYSYYMNNSSGGFAKPIIAAKGRKTRAESPLGWIGTMAESAIQADNKNDAKMCLYYAALRRPDLGLFSITETWFEYTGKKDVNGKKIFAPAYPPATSGALSADDLRQHMDNWENNMKQKQAAGDAYKGSQTVNLRGSVVFQDTKGDKEHVVRVKVAGKDYSILINGNPRAAQAINGLLNPDANQGPVEQWLSGARRNLSALLTSYSPLFWVANFQRDLLSSTMRISEADGWGASGRYLANRRKAWRVVSYINKYEDGNLGNSYYEQLYREFAENGGITGYTSLTTNKEYEELLSKYANTVDKPVLNAVKNVWDKFMGFGEAIEQVTRFAAYITARESGKSIEEAVNAAKEVSVNFNRKGSAKPISLDELDKLRTKSGKKLNKVQRVAALILSAMPGPMKWCYYFVNASLQALSSSAKLAKKSKGKAATWIGLYMGTSIALAMLSYLLSGDDDDEYLDLPDYLRHSTILIKVADGYYFKWSIPQEMRAFYAWADILVRKMMGLTPHKSAFAVGKEMALAASQWLPVNPFDAEDPLLSLVPDFLAPPAEIKANTNAFGSKIYDDMPNRSEAVAKKIPAYRKATQRTGELYVDLSEFLNDFTGGDESRTGWININPAIMEHLVEGYGGGIYDFAKMMVALPGILLGEDPVQMKEIPFVNKIILSVDETNMYSHTNEAFFLYKNIADNAKRVENEYRNSDNPERADAYKKEEDWRIYLLYKQYESDLMEVKERIDNAVDKTEEKLLKEEQNALREMFLNDVAKGNVPEVTVEISEDMKVFDKIIKDVMRPANEANKERLKARDDRDLDKMREAAKKRDSLKALPEYKAAEAAKKTLKKMREQLEGIEGAERGSQKDSVLSALQKNYDILKKQMSELQ